MSRTLNQHLNDVVSTVFARWALLFQVYCEAYGGNLAFIESASEQQFITSHMKTVNGTLLH